MSDETEEEKQLEAELRKKTEEKKEVFEITREADERLRKIREEERQKQDRLQQIRAERIEREQRERHADKAACLETSEKRSGNEELAKLRAEVEALRKENDELKRQITTQTIERESREKHVAHSEAGKGSGNEKESNENDKLRSQVAALSKERPVNEKRTLSSGHGSEIEELEQVTRKNPEQNMSLETLKVNLEEIMGFSEKQQNEKKKAEGENVKLTRRIKCLEDKLSAGQQIMLETQLRQVGELKSLTKETKELKQTLLTELYRQQQQQPATAEEQQRK